MGGRPLAELPLHLIGHSRGGSVVTEMARLLGAQGVWVDHVTTLDPRPVPPFGDASVTSYANVLFADNYWQTMGDGLFVPNGQSVFGAYNRKLLDLSGGYSSTHSDVHLWYHGTIDLATPATDTQATITATQRAHGGPSTEMAGAAAGFLYSLIGGGDRLSNLEPAAWATGGSVMASTRIGISVGTGRESHSVAGKFRSLAERNSFLPRGQRTSSRGRNFCGAALLSIGLECDRRGAVPDFPGR